MSSNLRPTEDPPFKWGFICGHLDCIQSSIPYLLVFDVGEGECDVGMTMVSCSEKNRESCLTRHFSHRCFINPALRSSFTLSLRSVAAVAEWYRHRIVAGFVTSSSPVPLKTRRVGQRCTLNLSRAETSSRWCGVVVRRGGASSGVVHVT
ncbi:uncharacterized protein TNCV_4487361 [Trichonephila clavipes]|nr:uncharacterized protein TNCV_4487361 [Trichonephila clavipes]